MNMMIRIKMFANNLIEPIKKPNGDLIDLRAAEDVFVPQYDSYKLRGMEPTMIPLGVGMILPDGYEAWVVPRSSLYAKTGLILVNSIGIIDNSYNGDNDQWFFPVICLRPTGDRNGEPGTWIHKNDRICQFRIHKNQPNFVFDFVSHLLQRDRGGFGSTGGL